MASTQLLACSPRCRLRALLLAACLLAAARCGDAALVLPISFTPVPVAESAVLYPMFANTSLDGVFVTGLQFGTPPQTLQLLIDTGSGITHVAGRGCGSSCGVGLSPEAGYDSQASSTAQRLPCDERCSCPQCECQTQGVEEPYCVFRIAYGARVHGWMCGLLLELASLPFLESPEGCWGRPWPPGFPAWLLLCTAVPSVAEATHPASCAQPWATAAAAHSGPTW